MRIRISFMQKPHGTKSPASVAAGNDFLSQTTDLSKTLGPTPLIRSPCRADRTRLNVTICHYPLLQRQHGLARPVPICPAVQNRLRPDRMRDFPPACAMIGHEARARSGMDDR